MQYTLIAAIKFSCFSSNEDNWSPLFISHSSSFPVIQVNVDIKFSGKKDNEFPVCEDLKNKNALSGQTPHHNTLLVLIVNFEVLIYYNMYYTII